MRKSIITASLSVLITLAVAAIAYYTLVRDSGYGPYDNFNYRSYAQAEGNVPSGYSGCPGSAGALSGGCNGCGSQTVSGQAQGNNIEAARQLAADYYTENYGDRDFTVEVKDFGCHQEAYILKEGKQVKRLSISGGSVYEIG